MERKDVMELLYLAGHMEHERHPKCLAFARNFKVFCRTEYVYEYHFALDKWTCRDEPTTAYDIYLLIVGEYRRIMMCGMHEVFMYQSGDERLMNGRAFVSEWLKDMGDMEVFYKEYLPVMKCEFATKRSEVDMDKVFGKVEQPPVVEGVVME